MKRPTSNVQRPNKLQRIWNLVIGICLVVGIWALGVPAGAATYTVTNTNDSGAGSLRQAINDAVANIGADTVEFNIPDTDTNYITAGRASYWRIRPTSVLPALDPDPSGDSVATSIDGTSQTTNQGDTNPFGPEIMIDGTSVGADDSGIAISTANCVIQGIIINNFGGDGLGISGASGNAIYGCYIGTDATGEASQANGLGIAITSGAQDNIVGSSESSNRNIISGNTNSGIEISSDVLASTISSGNKIFGNYIGVNRGGGAALANGGSGINLGNGSQTNEVGGINSGEGNIISGNTSNGINLDVSVSNTILGNLIGTSSDGASSVPNGENGIFLLEGSASNVIGNGSTAGRNIISGNTEAGIRSVGSGVDSLLIKGNYVGVNAAGTSALANGTIGIYLADGASHEVGGTGSGDGNVVSGNTENGIQLDAGSYCQILGNYVGIDASGANAIGNGVNGIFFGDNSSYNNIGDGTSDGRNIISANGDSGIEMTGTDTNSNEVNNNYIGTDANGAYGTGLENTNNGLFYDSDTKYNKVFSNRIRDSLVAINFANGSSGYEVSNNVIIGEEVTNSKGLFLLDGGEAGTAVVSSNEVRGFNTGIDVSISTEATLNINHSTVVKNNNSTGNGVGIWVSSGTVNISNCIVATNTTGIASSDSSVGIQLTGGTVLVSYSDLYGNNINYEVDDGTLTTTATIHALALFADSDNNDYHLNYNSPCINTGTPEGSDMGAYQYTGSTPEVRVISPNGSENWQEESSQTITWNASSESSDITSIDLSYSTDGGSNYTAITTGLSNSGSYSWTLPKADSTQARVKVVANSPSSTSSDESDSDFTISSKNVRLLGAVMTYPIKIRPMQGETTKIAYHLSTQADIKILLISKYGRVHTAYSAAAGAEGGQAGYNEISVNGNSFITNGYLPNGVYMIKLISQNKVIGSGHLVILD
ncbi:MAG: hypothetical protein HQ564_06400 [Candidatus Saganbacteria bacterium]|nr:hypothetical protein [Candidatus Saganbacteria bacterium]